MAMIPMIQEQTSRSNGSPGRRRQRAGEAETVPLRYDPPGTETTNPTEHLIAQAINEFADDLLGISAGSRRRFLVLKQGKTS